MKIFVPLGTQRFPFTRLLRALNGLVESGRYGKDDILVQSECVDVDPLFRVRRYIPYDEFCRLINEAELVISHGGVNTVIIRMMTGKPLLIVPRRAQFGEHVDDHQMEIATRLQQTHGVRMLLDMNALPAMIGEIPACHYQPWTSSSSNLCETIRRLIL